MSLTSIQIRESFLKFFEDKQHRRFKSASLVPSQDPTLFFTNAGMVPFKNVFTGHESVGTTRATSSQKCMRVSGKHNDLENVGRTHRHHTFFEMLGNFSFGDYFKAEAIAFAWEYLTEVLKLDKLRLWITVFREDDEAEQLWLAKTDVPKERIFRMDEKDNFWSMGETGPCGPCTEIYFDHGPTHGCGKPDCQVGCDCDRYMEIWNLVFMQFDRAAGGAMTPLPKPSVDTGMGLERLSCVVQGVHSNYDSDLFVPLLQLAAGLSGKHYGENPEQDVSMRVIADHIRSSVFLIGDGVLPSNEGRGYVLRRIMRRAIRHGRMLGIHESFLFSMTGEVIRQMEKAYPELKSNQKFIEEVILAEEQRFLETLEKGLEMITQEIAGCRASGKTVLSGEVAFRLYDTFGFPLDLTETIAAEAGLSIDLSDFEKRMQGQREKARSAWKGSGETQRSEVHQSLLASGLKSEFLGYQTLDCLSKVSAILQNGQRVAAAEVGGEIEVFCEYTTFYGESGGQVGDQGEIFGPELYAKVIDTQVPLPGLVAHRVSIESGRLEEGQEIHLKVDPATRGATRLNHTATHLLHAALRKVLGEHVKQAGSLVASDRLRFDFSHFKPLKPEEIRAVEDLVNEKIRADFEVEKQVMKYDEAISTGAMALFGEKYGDEVRVLKIEDFSTELCGGTHASRTGEIGLFKILSEASVASGVRRIEAATGARAFDYLRDLEGRWQDLARKLKVGVEEVGERVDRQLEQLKKYEKALAKLRAQGGGGGAENVLDQVREVSGVKVLALRRDVDDMNALRSLSDQLSQKLQSGILVLGADIEGKATLIVRVSKDLQGRFQAGSLVKGLAPIVEGSGGGRADMAQAGGSKVSALDEAIGAIYDLVV